MISTDITGGAGGGDANQVFNLLAVVANPDMYAEKIRTLMQATEENKKFLALIAPANEILELRDQTAAELAAAKDTLAQAKKDADRTRADARTAANATLANAKADASKRGEEAQRLLGEAQSRADRATTALQQAEAARKQVTDQQGVLAKELASVREQGEQNATAKKELAALRAMLVEMHQRHIQELTA